MAAHGWSRETAIAQSSHLYPEDMAALAAPWLARTLYAEGGTSPDAAAQTAHDAGRIPEPTVDAFWDAVRGDLATVSQWKNREVDRIDAETTQAATFGGNQLRDALANLDTLDAQGRLQVGGVAPAATSARQKDAHGAYPDLGDIIAAARFSVGAKRKQEYRALIGKARPNLPQEDVDAFMAEMDTLDDTKKEKAALHWFVKGGLMLPQEKQTLGKALEVADAFKINPYQTDTPQEVLRIAAQMAKDRSRELQGPFLKPEDIGLILARDCENGLKIYHVGESQQEAVWRLMRSQGFIFINPETNKVVADSPWCLLAPTESGSGPSKSAVEFWNGDPDATEEDIEEDPYTLGYTGIPKKAAFFRDRIVAFSANLNIDGYDPNDENWWDLDNDRVVNCEFFWDGTAEQMGLTHVPPDTPVYVHGDETETEMTVGDEENGIYERYDDNELTERARYENGERVEDLPLDETAPQPRREVSGNATPIASTKYSIREAREAIRAQNAEHPEGYTNKATGNVAFINGTQMREMTTETSIAKTMRHGFSIYEHLHAVALSPTLYENAALVRDDPDTKNGDSKVRILRYAAPVSIEREGALTEATAWLTVKTSEQNGHRIYSLELLELTKARRITEDTSSAALPRTRNLTNTVAYPGADVNPRRSIGGWLEQATEAHRAAEQKGDVETAQRLVHEAAERAGYRHQAAHGTGQFGFTVFDPNKSDDKRSLFFAGDPTLAATYQYQATDLSGRGSANTAFRDVASTIRPLELDLNAEYPNDAAFIHAVTEAVERAGGTVSVGHIEPGNGERVEVAPGEYIHKKSWPQDYILVTIPRYDGPKTFDVLTPDTLVREAKARNAAKEEELRGYAARLKAEYEAAPYGEYFDAFDRMSNKDRWLQAEHSLQTFLKNPQTYLEDERLFTAQSRVISSISINWSYYRQYDNFGIYRVALRIDNPLVIDAQGNNWNAIDIKLPGSNRKHWKTRQLAEYAQTHGYDGVQINNVYDLGPNYIPGADRKPSSVYIVFDGRQVKSLDPFTYDDRGNLIPLSERFDTAQPDIRFSIGGENPQATSARQKDAHGVYPNLGDVIAGARFSVGGKRKQEYRALIAKARPNLPQADVDAFMRELDTLNDTKTEKAALHWFVKGALILPEDREKLDMAVRMSGKWHLDFQAFDTPAALINEANARAEAKKKKPALAYLDPDAVPQLSNKRDLGHGVVVYDVEDSPAGQQAMRQIMNSHLGRNADGEFWSPWCLLTCSPKTGALTESARKYWAHYNKTGRAAAFHNGKLCAFQSSDTKRKKWWDLDDEDHGTKIPLPLSITSAEMGYASDDIPGDIVIQNGYEMTKDGELVPVAKPGGRTLLVGTRGSIAEGKTEKWIIKRGLVFKTETSLYKDGVLYKSVYTPNPAYKIIRFYADGNQSVAQSSHVGSPYYDRTIKDSNGLTLREDRGLTEEEANQNPFDNPDWRSVTQRNGDRRIEYNGGTDWTYENFENGTRIFYAEYRDAGGRGRLHGRTEYIDDDTGALVTEYYDHGVQVNHPVVNERIVPGQGTPQPRRQVGGNARRAPIEATTRTARIGVFREAQRRPGNGTGIDAKRLVHVADLPDWASRYGLPTALMANGRVLRKLAKKHAFTPELFADLIGALETPVAGFTDNALRNQRGSKGANDLVLLLALLTPTRQGGRGPTLAVLGSMNGHAMLTTAYGHDHGTENKLVGLVNGGYARWVDKTRVAKLPLLAETQFSLNSFNGPSDPSLGTVPNPGEEVKPGARLDVGGAERRLREANARVRTAALYYGRNPAVAEVANRAIAEIALFNEASRTGKKVGRETVKSAYADFGIQADDDDAAQIADRLNAMAKSERWSPRDKQGLSPRDALIPQERHLRATYDIHWSQAEKTAYTRGVEGAFGAARALARDAQEIAQTKRAEAEGVLGVAPAKKDKDGKAEAKKEDADETARHLCVRTPQRADTPREARRVRKFGGLGV